MNNAEFLKHIQQTYDEGLDIIQRKNADYAASTDPFKNFRSAEVVGVSPDRAILVRILDKIARISNLLNKQAEVKDESMADTIVDAINYLAILSAYLKDRNSKKTHEPKSDV